MKRNILLILAVVAACFAACFIQGCSGDSKNEPETIILGPDTGTVVKSGYTILELTQSEANNVTLSTLEKNSYQLKMTGDDPYVFSTKLSATIPSDQKMLEFEYKCDATVSPLQIFYVIDGVRERSSVKYGDLAATSTYQKFTTDISSFRNNGWGKSGTYLRIDTGEKGSGSFYIRNIKVRTMTDAEKKAADEAEAIENAKQQMAKNLESYLSKTYSSTVTSVKVETDKVTIEGTCGTSGKYVLADICPWQDVTEMETYPYTTEIANGNFSVTVNRKVDGREGIDYDRVFSKWAVVKVVNDTTMTLDSHARYADEVVPIESPDSLPLKNKKGLGAGDVDLYFQDCQEMNVGSITMNVLLDRIITGEGSGYSFGGKEYSLGEKVSYCDKIVSKTQSMGVAVSAIILLQSDSKYKDPENTGGYYTMPNMTTAEAFNMYAAALTYMASRYCKDNPGRIHNWIMHNEVDVGSAWTNMGSQPMMRYLDRYVKSMRICYNVVRQYDQNASILGSFTSSWTNLTQDGYCAKKMLEGIVKYSNAEGDFRWGVAYHPYPQDLFEPEYWNKDTEATYSMSSKYVTFKNLEVIDKWIKLPENLYKGTQKRTLHLSEQGTNSPTYASGDLKLQAAGGALAWKKVSLLDGIDAIQWHNWADNRAEGGLRIGLRAFKDDEYGFEDMQKKPVWDVWKAAGTSDESTVFDPYLTTIGISDWNKETIIHSVF